MSLFDRLFGSNAPSSDRGGGSLDERLAEFEREHGTAPHGYKGTPLNRAGDVALREGDQTRAVKYYGRAIDSFLEDQQREAARGVANKMIRVYPQAVRTLCTLVWLDLAARHMATALLHLRDYIEAVKNIDQHALAADQIFNMARISPQTEFLNAAADALDHLDFAERAEEVRGWANDGGSPEVARDDAELEARCMEAAVHSNTRSG